MYEILWEDARGVQHYTYYRNRKQAISAAKKTSKYFFIALIDYENKRIIRNKGDL